MSFNPNSGSGTLNTKVAFVMVCVSGVWPTARVTESNPHIWRKTSLTDPDPDPLLLRNYIDTIEEFQA